MQIRKYAMSIRKLQLLALPTFIIHDTREMKLPQSYHRSNSFIATQLAELLSHVEIPWNC